ncbi:MAG: hypothetical protein LCH54_02225 [Bacteroidetes bacterium]|nr:hypothetical protein [Bacteroidota bacterium]MCA0445027.1 hypothetical protein [Bacteroidota bacterium]
MKVSVLPLLLFFVLMGCHNPFAPRLADEKEVGKQSGLNAITIDGFFETFKSAYQFKDTSLYGKLLDPSFTFSYYDYDRGTNEFWGREQDMRTTYGLFLNASQLELDWNFYREYRIDSLSATVSRAFRLRVVFSSVDIIQGEGNARFELIRQKKTDPWKLKNWTDESSF